MTFVDSDDWLEPGVYQSAVSYLQQHPGVSILGYGHNKVQDTCSSPCLMPEMTLSREEALDSYLTANKLAIEATVWSRIYRRQAIEGLTFREGRSGKTTSTLLRHSIRVQAFPYVTYRGLQLSHPASWGDYCD